MKLDALYVVDTTEANLKRDTATRIATHHDALVEKAEQQADDEFLEIRTVLAGNELRV